MVTGKTSAGNLLIGGGVVTGTGTASLSYLEIISQNSIPIGLLISLIGVLGGLCINFIFKHKEHVEMRRHNMRIEELSINAKGD